MPVSRTYRTFRIITMRWGDVDWRPSRCNHCGYGMCPTPTYFYDILDDFNNLMDDEYAYCSVDCCEDHIDIQIREGIWRPATSSFASVRNMDNDTQEEATED